MASPSSKPLATATAIFKSIIVRQVGIKGLIPKIIDSQTGTFQGCWCLVKSNNKQF